MKNLKITAASAALLLTLFAVDASAQPQQRRGGAPNGKEPISAEKMAEIATDKLDQELDLSDSQESKIYKINLKYAEAAVSAREAMKAEREANKEEQKAEGEKRERPDREAMKAKQEEMQASRKAQKLEIMAILNDSQKIDYAEMLAKQPRRGGNQHGAPQQGQMRGRRGGEQGAQQQGGRGKQGGAPQGAPQQGGQKEGQPQRQGERPQGERPQAE